MTDNQQLFEEIIQQFPEAEKGNLFGKPCGKIEKKAFVAFFQDEMVFKIGKLQVEAMKPMYPGAKNFDPSGKHRPMKDWIQIPAEYKEEWPEVANQAAAFLLASL